MNRTEIVEEIVFASNMFCTFWGVLWILLLILQRLKIINVVNIFQKIYSIGFYPVRYTPLIFILHLYLFPINPSGFLLLIIDQQEDQHSTVTIMKEA